MIVYQDKTFCGFYEKCKKGDMCHRKLTGEIEKKAAIRDLPIAKFLDRPECFVSFLKL